MSTGVRSRSSSRRFSISRAGSQSCQRSPTPTVAPTTAGEIHHQRQAKTGRASESSSAAAAAAAGVLVRSRAVGAVARSRAVQVVERSRVELGAVARSQVGAGARSRAVDAGARSAAVAMTAVAGQAQKKGDDETIEVIRGAGGAEIVMAGAKEMVRTGQSCASPTSPADAHRETLAQSGIQTRTIARKLSQASKISPANGATIASAMIASLFTRTAERKNEEVALLGGRRTIVPTETRCAAMVSIANVLIATSGILRARKTQRFSCSNSSMSQSRHL